VQAVRYLVVLAAGFVAGSRVVDAVRSWQEWHQWMSRDPATAGEYRNFFMVSATVSGLSLAIAILVWWLLRPAADSRHH
jgi:hypothetical protein